MRVSVRACECACVRVSGRVCECACVRVSGRACECVYPAVVCHCIFCLA